MTELCQLEGRALKWQLAEFLAEFLAKNWCLEA